MKVILASLSYLPNTGGLVTYIASFSKWLRWNGNNLSVVCANNQSSRLPALEQIDEVPVHRVPALRSAPFDVAFRPFVSALRFRSWFAQHAGPDDVFVVRHIYIAAALAAIPSLRERTLYLLPLVAVRLVRLNMQTETPLRRIRSALLLGQLYLLEAWVLARLPHVAVLSESKREEVVQTFSRRRPIHVIPPGIDLERFRPPIDRLERDAVRRSIGISSAAYVVMTVGRLVIEKNIATLIRAIGLLKDTDITLVVVGGGPLHFELSELAAQLGLGERVVLLGHRNDVEVVLRAADAFVLPSTYEGFGHAFLEALAAGVPVAGLRSAPPAIMTATEEIVRADVGNIVEHNTPESFAATIITMRKGERKHQAHRCRTYVEERFSWQRHFERIVNILSKGDVPTAR